MSPTCLWLQEQTEAAEVKKRKEVRASVNVKKLRQENEKHFRNSAVFLTPRYMKKT
jgi:hypothetical protein